MAGRAKTDQAILGAWLRSANGKTLVALPPPTRDRYTQTDGRDDAVELMDGRGLPDDTPFVFWHFQSQRRAFVSKELVAPLLLHWGGDLDVVLDALGSPPEPFTLRSLGPDRALEVTKPFTLPEPLSQQAVAAVERVAAAAAEGGLTPETEDWLRAALPGKAGAVAVEVLAAFSRLTPEELEVTLGDLDEALASSDTVLRLAAVAGHPRLRELAKTAREAGVGHPAYVRALAVLGDDETLLGAADALDPDPDTSLGSDGARGVLLTTYAAVRFTTGADPVAVGRALLDRYDESALRCVVEGLAECRGARAGWEPRIEAHLAVASDAGLPTPWRELALKAAMEMGTPADRTERFKELVLAGLEPWRTGVFSETPEDPRLGWNDFRRIWSACDDVTAWGDLPQPTPARTSADIGHRVHRRLHGDGSPYLFWTWPDQQTAFDADGRLIAPLPIHTGGDSDRALRLATSLHAALPREFKVTFGSTTEITRRAV